MGKTRMEELFYELYASSKQHDSWQRYAMILELRELMKQPKESGSDPFGRSGEDRRLGGGQFREGDRQTYGSSAELLDLRFREYLMLRNDDDDETWTWTEHYSEMDDETDLLEEESIPQSKVPLANSEIVRSIEPGKVDLGLENEEYVVLNENLEQEWDQMDVNEKLEADGDVERGQKMIIDTETFFAHKVFVKMPSKEKRMKHLKAWKFKFKPTSKRSKLMDDMFSLVEETALLKKDPKETIWDGVKKEFKETMVSYGKTRVDRFKLVDKKESRPEVMDMNQTFLYHQIGHGVDTLLVLKRVVHDKEMAVVRQRATSLMICDCSNRSSRANRVWKPGGLLCVQDHSGGSILMRTQRFHGLHLQRIIYMDMKFQEVIVVNVETGSKEYSHESFGSKGLAYDGCVILGMNFAGFERGEAELLATSQKMQRIDLFSFCCSCTNQILVAIHTGIEENLEFNQLLAAVERFSREVIEELAKRIVIEQKIEGGLICGDVKFHLKHKWRFRLLESFSRLELLALIILWFSQTYELSGLLKDSSNGGAESSPIRNYATEQPLLWLQINSEKYLIDSEFQKKKQMIGYKTWMFKYKAPIRRRQFLHHFDKEVPIETNWAVQRIWDKDSPDVGITDAYYVLQDELEQVMNHTPFSVIELGRLKDPDALLILLHGDGSFQIKHKWRFKLLLVILEWELYSDRPVLVTNYAQQLDISRLMILMSVGWFTNLRQLLFTALNGVYIRCFLANHIAFFSTNLEVKVSSKEGDLI